MSSCNKQHRILSRYYRLQVVIRNKNGRSRSQEVLTGSLIQEHGFGKPNLIRLDVVWLTETNSQL